MRLCPACGRAAYGSGDICMVCGAHLDAPKTEAVKQIEHVESQGINALNSPAPSPQVAAPAPMPAPAPPAPAPPAPIPSASPVPLDPFATTAPAPAPNVVPQVLEQARPPSAVPAPQPVIPQAQAAAATGPTLPGEPVFDISFEDNNDSPPQPPNLPGEPSFDISLDTPPPSPADDTLHILNDVPVENPDAGLQPLPDTFDPLLQNQAQEPQAAAEIPDPFQVIDPDAMSTEVLGGSLTSEPAPFATPDLPSAAPPSPAATDPIAPAPTLSATPEAAISEPLPPPPPPPAETSDASLDTIWPKQPTRPPAQDDDLSFLNDEGLDNPDFESGNEAIPQSPSPAADDVLAGLWDDLNIEETAAEPTEDSPDLLEEPLADPSPQLDSVNKVLDVLGAEIKSDNAGDSSVAGDLSPFSDPITPLEEDLFGLEEEDDAIPSFDPSHPLSFSEPDPKPMPTPEPPVAITPSTQGLETSANAPTRPATANLGEVARLTSSQMARELAHLAQEAEQTGDITTAVKLWRAAVLLNPLFPQAGDALKRLTQG